MVVLWTGHRSESSDPDAALPEMSRIYQLPFMMQIPPVQEN